MPENGVVGRLTTSQYNGLKSFWREFFRLVDNAPDKGTDTHEHEQTEISRELFDDSKESELGNNTASSKANQPSSNAVKDDNLKEKLRAEQELADAKAALEKYGRARFLDTFWNMIMMDDPDVIVLKFLRARKWNVSAGVAMMAACMKWRIEFGVEKIIEKGEEGYLNQEGFLHQLKIGKTFVQGTDRQGRPVVYINVRLHKASDQSPKTLEEFIVFSMECVRLMLTPPLVEKVTIIIDMSGFGLANMDWKSLAFIVKCLESYYPESLNVLVVHNPPWVFQGLWKIIAPMWDPVVRAKIQISKTTEELQDHIDARHLLSNLGGSNAWKWNYTPVVKDENKLMKSSAEERKIEMEKRKKLIHLYSEYTRQWAAESNQHMELKDDLILPEDPSVSARLRAFVTHHLRVQYFVLDPYIRGRSIYHRQGRVIGNGLITFTYPQLSSESSSSPSPSSPYSSSPSPSSSSPPDLHHAIDLWEVLGHNMSREHLLILIEKLKLKFEDEKIVYPVL